jgi:nitric oxide reductase NorD protein
MLLSPFPFQKQRRFFGFNLPKAHAEPQEEYNITYFMDVQRRTSLFLRALLANDFVTRPASSASSGTRFGGRPYIEESMLYLPDACAEHNGISGADFYRAAAIHCAAHMVYRQKPLEAKYRNAFEIALIGLIEDARVETLAIRRYPGLKKLWGRFHTVTPEQSETAGDYLNRLARALLDENYEDPDPWIALGRKLFAEAQDRLGSNDMSQEIGLALAQAFVPKRIKFYPRHAVRTAYYRDDNYSFWDFRETKSRWRLVFSYDTPDQVVKADSEMSGEVVQQVLDFSIAPDEGEDQGGGNLARKEAASIPFLYPEWDYESQKDRLAWTSLFEKPSQREDPSDIDSIAEQHKHIINQLRYLLDAMHPQGVLRLRRLEEGDEIDLGPALDSLLNMRAGVEPSPRIMMRNWRKSRDIAVMTLLDLSQSTNNLVAGHEHTVLDLTLQATVLLAEAIQKVGDPFAIHGFCSNGRHDVAYYRFKDFGHTYDKVAKARLAGMTGQLSTRMGAAIRHATHHLRQQNSLKKLLLVITDGEPADIDERDPRYLRYDTKRAVDEARRAGIIPYCISLDPAADQYVSRIFGLRNYIVVDHVERLPDRLPLLYAAITR